MRGCRVRRLSRWGRHGREDSALADAVIAANPRTVVVLSNGGVVRLSGIAERVAAIVEGLLSP
jgi:hypothetical protein